MKILNHRKLCYYSPSIPKTGKKVKAMIQGNLKGILALSWILTRKYSSHMFVESSKANPAWHPSNRTKWIWRQKKVKILRKQFISFIVNLSNDKVLVFDKKAEVNLSNINVTYKMVWKNTETKFKSVMRAWWKSSTNFNRIRRSCV